MASSVLKNTYPTIELRNPSVSVLLASVLARSLPGYFKFAHGKNPRYIYIEREFDITHEADEADHQYEKWIAMRDRGDYTYPGAYNTPDYLTKLRLWQDYNEALSTLERDRRKDQEREIQQGNLGWAERDAVKSKWRKIIDAERQKLFEKMGKPTEQRYEPPKNPIHTFANRIFRISLADRLIEYYNTDGKRSKLILESIQPIRTIDKIKLLDRACTIPDDVADLVAGGNGVGYPDYTTQVYQSFQTQVSTSDKWGFRRKPEIPIIDRDIFLQDVYGIPGEGDVWAMKSNAQNSGDTDRVRELNQIEGEMTGTQPLSPEAQKWVENRVVERQELLRIADQYRARVKYCADHGYYAGDGVENGDNILAGRTLPTQLTQEFDAKTHITKKIPPWLPAREAASIPHFKDGLQVATETQDDHFSGGDSHRENRGDAFIASAFWSDDFYVAARLAVSEGHKYEQFKYERDDLIRKHSGLKPEDCPPIPHLGKGVELFPHQALAAAHLANSPDVAIIDMDMGGGKTVLNCIIDAMLMVQAGGAKRPAVIMPGNTIAQQVDEILHKFGSDINVIAITSQSWKAWDNGEDDVKDTVRDIITAAPPNTIILISYSWLAYKPILIDTGKVYTRGKKAGQPKFEKVFWKGTWLVEECGVDMVTLDESHRIKNPDSDVNSACCAMSSAAVRRIGSGTVFPNTPGDIFGQLKFLDPTFFGTWEDFCSRYDLETEGGSVIAYSTESLKNIRGDLIRDLGMISMRRQYWMYMLPERIERRHAVRLSPTLQKFYNAIWKEILDQLQNPDNPFYDAKIAAVWNSSQGATDELDEAEEGSGEAALLLKILVLDQYLTCPTATIGGQLEGRERNKTTGEMESVSRLSKIPTEFLRIRKIISKMKPEDAVSPKVRKAAEIIDEHFSSEDSKMSDGSIGKVILFVQHRESAEHFKQWLPKFSTTIGATNLVYYEAGMQASLDAFRHDPSVKVLCAVDKSLREGHNLQFANCVIRADILWSPGPTEQVYGRVFRPGSKATKVFIHAIVTEGTGEVAKYGRLLCKYHYMRKVNSDFSDDVELDPIIMTPEVLSPASINDLGHPEVNPAAILELNQIGSYIERYDAQYDYDMEDSKRLSVELGHEMLQRAGSPVPGSRKILGYLPEYAQEDITAPFRCKFYESAKRNGPPPYIVVDDDWLMEVIQNDGDARSLGLKYVDSDGDTYFTRKAPSRLAEWIALVHETGYSHFEMTKFKDGKAYHSGVYGKDGELEQAIPTGSDPNFLVPAGTPNVPTTPEATKPVTTAPPIPKSAPVTPEQKPEPTPQQETPTDPPRTEKVKEPWELVAVHDCGYNSEYDGGRHEAYVIYRRNLGDAKGRPKFEYTLRYHFDQDSKETLLGDIRNVDDEGLEIKTIRSNKDILPELAIPESVLTRFQEISHSFDEEMPDDYSWNWKQAHQSELMMDSASTPVDAVPPEPSPEESPTTPSPEDETSYPDTVIENLHVVTFNGITYLAVGSDEDDRVKLRRFGFRFFNALVMRKLANITDAKRILKDLGTHGIVPKNPDSWDGEIRRVLKDMKLKSHATRAREQLGEMRILKKRSGKVKPILHVLQIGSDTYAAIRKMESNAVLQACPSARFKVQHSAYWAQCLNRDAASKIIKRLADGGYQVQNWDEFKTELDTAFSLVPAFDLSLKMRPQKTPVTHPTPSAAPVRGIDKPIPSEKPDSKPETEKVQIGTTTIYMPKADAALLRTQIDIYSRSLPGTHESVSAISGIMWQLGERGVPKADVDAYLANARGAKGVIKQPETTPPPVEPVATSGKKGPKLPPLPKVTNPEDPLANVIDKLREIYNSLDADEVA